jgi:protein-disulfide isomerase
MAAWLYMETIMRIISLALASALTLSLAACGGATAGGGSSGKKLDKVAAPAGKTWSTTVVKTAEEGFLMGNPNAPVKLIEYGSIVCGACANFAKQSGEPIKKYIETGQVSFEFRNFLLQSWGPVDAMASSVMHCAGPDRFYALKDNFFASHEELVGNLKTIDQTAAATAEKMPVEKRFIEFAKIMKLTDWFKARGVTEAEVNTCLGKVDNLTAREKATMEGAKQFNITGTPTFILNGKVLEGGNTWDFIEAELKKAGATG